MPGHTLVSRFYFKCYCLDQRFLKFHHLQIPLLLNGDYNEAAEDMQYRLRTGEIVDETLYPKVPYMRSEEARLDTFASWPSNSPMRPTDLAQAGLYYMGQNDLVQCFCCAGMMGAWESGDCAWEEHEKHYRNCFFILGHDVGNMPLVGGSQVEEARWAQALQTPFSRRSIRPCVSIAACTARLQRLSPPGSSQLIHGEQYKHITIDKVCVRCL
uniref:X-linked inhibitor of apoptosis n=1 Tax=Neogobius melanostomus TaxID=47308 RepID=A0A8C6WQR5_9GOBI